MKNTFDTTNLNDQQATLVDEVITALKSGKRTGINLVARAGCGKTYTLMATARLVVDILSGKDQIQFAAYNKAIADEIKGKLAKAGLQFPKVTAGTVHSIGWSSWSWKVAGKDKTKTPRIEEKKVALLVQALRDELSLQAISEKDPRRKDLLRSKSVTCDRFAGFVKSAVSLAKQKALGYLGSYEDLNEWQSITDHFGLLDQIEDDEDVDVAELFRLCILIYKRSLEQCWTVVDFDDMILAPLVFSAKVWEKRIVLLDEAQDTNPARRALALKALAPNGVLVAVGDPAQAIYGFTGADSDAMDLIKEQLGSKELPLNVTYRCGKSIVALAQTWVPDIQAHENNPDGEVVNVTLDEFWTSTVPTLTPKDAILCRNTAPLIEMAYNLLRQGVACRVEGREIGQGLITLATRWKVKTTAQLLLRLDAYEKREIQKALEKNLEDRAQAVEDKCQTLRLIIERLSLEGKKNVQDLVDFINSLFSGDDINVLTLSTVHKSKGREWNHVVLLGRNAFMPSRYARREWQLTQEANLQYVAVTRAISKLTEVFVEV